MGRLIMNNSLPSQKNNLISIKSDLSPERIRLRIEKRAEVFIKAGEYLSILEEGLSAKDFKKYISKLGLSSEEASIEINLYHRFKNDPKDLALFSHSSWSLIGSERVSGEEFEAILQLVKEGSLKPTRYQLVRYLNRDKPKKVRKKQAEQLVKTSPDSLIQARYTVPTYLLSEQFQDPEFYISELIEESRNFLPTLRRSDYINENIVRVLSANFNQFRKLNPLPSSFTEAKNSQYFEKFSGYLASKKNTQALKNLDELSKKYIQLLIWEAKSAPESRFLNIVSIEASLHYRALQRLDNLKDSLYRLLGYGAKHGLSDEQIEDFKTTLDSTIIWAVKEIKDGFEESRKALGS